MFDREMQDALIADGEKLAAMTGEDHGPYFLDDAPDLKQVTFTYRNWRGVVAVRTVTPIDLTFEENSYHNGPQWFLNAHDPDRDGARRSFAVQDILSPIRHVREFNNPATQAPIGSPS